MTHTHLKLGYLKADLVAAQHLLAIHTAKLTKAVESDNFAEACTAIRAIEDECANASRIAATLSFKARESNNQNTPRIQRCGN
jgi:hypothetical protein